MEYETARGIEARAAPCERAGDHEHTVDNLLNVARLNRQSDATLHLSVRLYDASVRGVALEQHLVTLACLFVASYARRPPDYF
jgi:hypothetical protein